MFAHLLHIARKGEKEKDGEKNNEKLPFATNKRERKRKQGDATLSD